MFIKFILNKPYKHIIRGVIEMINVLIADDNINYAIALMNYINEQNRNIRVCNITKDGEETLNVLILKLI